MRAALCDWSQSQLCKQQPGYQAGITQFYNLRLDYDAIVLNGVDKPLPGR